jgi:hypothetical protein
MDRRRLHRRERRRPRREAGEALAPLLNSSEGRRSSRGTIADASCFDFDQSPRSITAMAASPKPLVFEEYKLPALSAGPDKAFERALRLLELPQQSWGSLSGVYEIIKADVRPKKWQSLSVLGVDERDLDAFRSSIGRGKRHHGLFARFSLAKNPPLNCPSMTLTEAQDFVRRMVEGWVKQRHCWRSGKRPTRGECDKRSARCSNI